MKKILLLFIIAFTTMIVRAQEVDSLECNQVNIDSLSAKCDKLQHDYDFLSCKFELSQVNQKLDYMGNNLNISSNAILINCYHGGYNRKLYAAYKENYLSSVEWYEVMSENAKSVKTFVLLKIKASKFTEDEVELLMNSVNLVEKGLSRIESALDYYETVLSMYRDL